MRRPGHNTVCCRVRDRGTERFSDVWAVYFADHPGIAASWNRQNGYTPPGYGESLEFDSTGEV
ncbi:hypothetical protein ABZY09_47515 [Streptomyces sp. NPDC002928]|uniref:hypothetical protein n=1 Tax=Streptomyces sp. NPDC002928 TaxID=3154440 RepID=UPI0033B9A2E0